MTGGLLCGKNALGRGGDENSTSKGPEAAGLSLNRQRPHCVSRATLRLPLEANKQTKHPLNILLYDCIDTKTNAAQAGLILYVHYYCTHFFLLIKKKLRHFEGQPTYTVGPEGGDPA